MPISKIPLSAVSITTGGGNLVAGSGTNSISSTSGALVVVGGAGVTGNLNVAGNIGITSGVFWTVNGAPYSSGGGSTYSNANVTSYLPTDSTITGIQANIGSFYTYANTKIGTNNNSNLVINSTTTSISTTTGALVVAGGAGVAGNVYAGGNIYASQGLSIGTTAFGAVGEIRATNNITAYYSSDRKFKTNIAEIPNALSTVVAISGKLFDWTDDYIDSHGGEDGYFLRREDFGVIAQDVESVFPRAVRTRDNGTLAVDYEKLSALAFAAITELSAQVDQLNKELDRIKLLTNIQ
jgi:hypothetical protein